MKLLKLFVALMPLSFLLSALEANAVIDPNASVVKVRTSCQEGSATLDNCFTSFADLQNWITTRNPSDASPLLIEVGPGSFGSFSCNHAGISLRGAGADKTRLGNNSFYAIAGNLGCSNLNVEAVNADPFTGMGITWMSNGNSTWTNVTVRGQPGWIGSRGGQAAGCGIHRFRASRIIGIGSSATAYEDDCGEHWFIGSEISAGSNAGITGLRVGLMAKGGKYNVYGSNISAIGSANCGNNCNGGIRVVAVSVTGGSHVHIHGTGIDAIGSGPYDVAGIWADDNSEIHANQSAYNLVAAAGQTRYRIKDDGTIHFHAPYLWEQHQTPPAGVVSVTGADMAVATDAPDGQPHLLIYNANCSSKWYDTVTGACRP